LRPISEPPAAQVLGSVPEAEFQVLVDLLKGLRIFEAGQRHGPQGLVDIVAEQSLLPAPIEVRPSSTVFLNIEGRPVGFPTQRKPPTGIEADSHRITHAAPSLMLA